MTKAATEHFEAGRLDDAIQVMNQEVKANPRDVDRRGLLAEFLCLAGNLDRADMQLDAMAQQEPALTPGVSLFRQLIRGEQARRQFYAEGRVPELLGPPPDHLKMQLEASILLRQGNAEAANGLLQQAEEMRPHVAGTCDGRAFDDLRDLDDLTASAFEVITSTGKFYFIPMERVAFIEFRKPERPRDLLWRRAQMVVEDGPDGEVYLPAIYAGPEMQDARARLGRSTDWVGGDGRPMRGVGQRTFLVGEESLPIMQLGTLEFGAGGG